MVEKEFVNEFVFRTKMFIKSIPAIKVDLIKESKRKSTPFRERLVLDSINVLKSIQIKNDFDYYDAFILTVCLSQSFEDLKKKIISGEHDLNQNFYREDYWREENIEYNDGLYFSYPFLFETYKTELSIDLKKLSELVENGMRSNNATLVAKNYISFVNKVKKKS